MPNLEAKYAAAVAKHPPQKYHDATFCLMLLWLMEEMEEAVEAEESGNLTGPHGLREELEDCIIVARRIIEEIDRRGKDTANAMVAARHGEIRDEH